MEVDQIFLEDCEVTMSRLPDKYVDYIITSPPYNFGRDSIHNIKSKYEGFEDNMTQEEYYEWQKRLIEQMLRITKYHIFYNIQLLSGNKQALFKLIGYFYDKIKEVIIWDKFSGEPAMLQGVLNSVYEFILVFSNDAPDKRVFSDVEWRGTVDNIIRNKKNYSKGAIDHFAIMPLDLPRRIIQTWSKEGDLIYDPFTGLGTTQVACIREKRHYLGSEIVPAYYAIAQNNIKIESMNKTLF